MPDTMIERVARAMWDAREKSFPNRTQLGWEDGTELSRRLMVSQARAGLEAMREPTPAMIDRFVSRALCVSVHGDGGWSNYAREQWSAMLSAAIEGE